MIGCDFRLVFVDLGSICILLPGMEVGGCM